MANKEQTLHTFWSNFGLKAYDENSVPDNAVLPYLTYNVSVSGYDETTMMNASLWYRSTSWSDITAKAEEISRAIGLSGKTLAYDDGKIYLTKGSPFSQRMSDEDDTIRRIYFNVTAEYLSAY